MRRPRGHQLITFRRAAALPRRLREPRVQTGQRELDTQARQCRADTPADEEAPVVLEFGWYHLILWVACSGVRTRIVVEMPQTGRSWSKNGDRGNLKVNEGISKIRQEFY